jgi:hypothetical protein
MSRVWDRESGECSLQLKHESGHDEQPDEEVVTDDSSEKGDQ